YMAMELVDGEDLGSLLERRHQLSVVDACRLLQPVAAALAHAHAAGVIHRDVKPSNILLRRVAAGTAHSIQLEEMSDAVIPLLSDFGIARAADAPELTTIGRTIGTPAYMAPEQCAGQRELDGRADIYSLGTVLYRALVGRAPFVGSTTQILHAHVYEALAIPDNIWRTLPPAMVTILQKALQKDPGDRYNDAGVLAADLTRMMQDGSPS
ncbi:MAG: serine/threonine protein kinase, partial [Anaerolineae bacterium]|nr:serine/threonine protein kinase [Anaerolineae bacterium]